MRRPVAVKHDGCGGAVWVSTSFLLQRFKAWTASRREPCLRVPARLPCRAHNDCHSPLLGGLGNRPLPASPTEKRIVPAWSSAGCADRVRSSTLLLNAACIRPGVRAAAAAAWAWDTVGALGDDSKDTRLVSSAFVGLWMLVKVH